MPIEPLDRNEIVGGTGDEYSGRDPMLTMSELLGKTIASLGQKLNEAIDKINELEQRLNDR